jgi:N-acetylmuramoyl-L-alanine amidase
VFLDQSILFAEKLQKEFKSIGRYDRGVRQAGFLVLYKTTMPSVLIETGFLTNPNEEKFLADADGQTKMANSMFAAFEKYKNELEGVDGQTTNTTQGTTDSQVKPEVNEEINSVDKVIFRVQIETSSTKISATSSRFKGFQVFEYVQDNLYKYTVGSFVGDYKSANDYKNKMREEGFVNAFVVAFLNGERINLEKAIKLAQK